MSFVDELEQHLTDGIVVERRRRSRRRRAAMAGGAVIAAALAVAGVRAVLDTEPPTQLATEGDDTTTTTADIAPGPADTTILPAPESPPTEDAGQGEPNDQARRSLEMVGSVTLRFGSELFVWGGARLYEEGAVADNPGIRYDLTDDTWRELPPAPGGPQTEAVGVWTGNEVIVCCGRGTGGTAAATAIAYNPAADTWRELASPPLTEPAGAVWLDGRLYVISRFVTASYDPATDTWERLTMAPDEIEVSPSATVLAVDSKMVVWPVRPSRSVSSGLLYDPATDTWSTLPDPPDGFHPAMADVAWTGEELIIVGGLPAPMADDSERLVGARLDWATMTWRALPDVWPEPESYEGNLGSASILWTGEVAVVAASALGSGVDPIDGAIAAYNPATDQWRRLSTPDGWGWNPTLIEAEDEVLTVAGGRLHRLDATADAGDPVGASGLPSVTSPPTEDGGVRDVPLTLVGTNGNGGGILVLDLEDGGRRTYEAGRHHRLGGAITDLGMADGWLYVWSTDGPTVRFSNAAMPFDGTRLVMGELTQPGDVVRADGWERSVLPVAGSTLVWEWEVADDRGLRRVTRLFDLDAGPDAAPLVEVPFTVGFGPQGVGSDGSLVVGGDDESVTVVGPDGRQLSAGSGAVLAVAGDEILIQQCGAEGCRRRWADIATGDIVRIAAPDTDTDRRWLTVGGPTIPSHSPPLDPVSPDGSQILVGSIGVDDTVDSGAEIELLRVDVETLTTDVVPLAAGLAPGAVATWSRTGRHVVVVDGDDLIVVDLRTGMVSEHPAAIPDGFFILAAG